MVSSVFLADTGEILGGPSSEYLAEKVIGLVFFVFLYNQGIQVVSNVFQVKCLNQYCFLA